MRRLPILLLFFLSGLSALLYQVSWVRQATLVFGVSVYAYSVVLAAFMGGTALGSAWMARRADRAGYGLAFYARLQIGIGLFGILLPFALPGLMPLYASIARSLPADSWLLTVVRSLFSALLLIPPTFLMGATLPVMARAIARRTGGVGSAVGQLYAAETLGAAIGCGLAGLFLLRILGTQQTVFVAAGINLLAAAGAWWVSRRWQVEGGKSQVAGRKSPVPNPQSPISNPQSPIPTPQSPSALNATPGALPRATKTLGWAGVRRTNPPRRWRFSPTAQPKSAPAARRWGRI